MGHYTTTSRVQSLCKRVPAFTNTSPIREDEVEVHIDAVEAEIDVALAAKGYASPATSPDSLVTWLRKLATEGVAATVLKSLYQDAGGPNSEATWAVWEKRYQDGLKKLRDGSAFPASVEISGGAGVSSWTTDYAGADSPLETTAEPVFSMDMEW